jgi:DNA-binding response OmpR family regulator
MIRAKRKILFVDSAQDNLAAYERSFGQMHNVILAHGQAEAAKIMGELADEIDAVVCELAEDDAGARSCYDKVLHEYADLVSRVIFIGDHGALTDAARGRGLTVLIKPVRPAVLLAEIYKIPPRKPSGDAAQNG